MDSRLRRLALSLALLGAGLSTCGGGRPPRPNVLLISIDTLRPDHMSAYGYGRATTPFLEEFAADSLRFTHAQSPRAKTTPAVATLLTGLYPHAHGVRDLTMPLDRRVPLVSEVARRAGYRTGAILGNWVLRDEGSGLARGFDLWVEDLPDVGGVPPHDVPERRAESITDGALVALGLESTTPDGAGPRRSLRRGDSPWFLWLHYMDPHGLYDPAKEHDLFHSETPEPTPWSSTRRAGERHPLQVARYNVPPEADLGGGRFDAAWVRDRYDGEIRGVDAALRRLFERLEAEGQLENTLVILTADHGESLGEHAYWFEHGRYAYEATCRVPLLVRLPGTAPGVRHSDISLADLAPTLLEWCDLPALPRSPKSPGGPRGISRAELLEADDPEVHPVFSEKIERAERTGTVQTKAVRIGDWKLMRRFVRQPSLDVEGPNMEVLSSELYELVSDPREEHPLDPSGDEARSRGAPLADLESALLTFCAADENFPELGDLLQQHRADLERNNPEVLRMLDALGY